MNELERSSPRNAKKKISNRTCSQSFIKCDLWLICLYLFLSLLETLRKRLIFVKLWPSLYLSHRPKWLSSAHRQTFLLANMFLLITGCLSAAAPTYFWLVMARALVGLAIGGIVVPFDNLADAWWISVVNPDWHHQKMMMLANWYRKPNAPRRVCQKGVLQAFASPLNIFGRISVERLSDLDF